MDQRLVEAIVAAAPGGVISADRLATLVPVETMSADETAQLILDLERAGVSVEVDPALTTPGRRAGPHVVPDARLNLGEDAPGAPVSSEPQSLKRLSPNEPAAQRAPWRRPVTTLAIVLVLLALALVWRFVRGA